MSHKSQNILTMSMPKSGMNGPPTFFIIESIRYIIGILQLGLT